MQSHSNLQQRANLFVLIFALMLAGFVLLAWNLYHFNEIVSRIIQKDSPALQLKMEIAALEEQVTLLAELVVEGGDLVRMEQHKGLSEELDKKISEALRLLPPEIALQIRKKTQDPERALVEAEKKAFDLVLQGQRTEAEKIIFGEAYKQQEALYKEGMQLLDDYLAQARQRLLKDEKRTEIMSLVIVVVLLFSLLGLLYMLREELKMKRRLQQSLMEIQEQKNLLQHQKNAIEKQNTEIKAQKLEILRRSEEIGHQRDEILRKNEALAEQKTLVEEAHQNLHLLSEIGKELTATLLLDEILQKVYHHLQTHLIAAEHLSIATVSDKDAQFAFAALLQEGKLEENPQQQELKAPFYEFVWQQKQEVIIQNFDTQYTLWFKVDEAVSQHFQSMIFLPLMGGGAFLGVLSVQSPRKEAYSIYDLDFLRNLALYVAIALQNAESFARIESQSKELRKKNEDIVSSINYASRIQKATLPKIEDIRKVLPESFVLYKPRDIVSGDFYWFTEQQGKIFLAAVDCTGHGVPGAFMSLIGTNILNEIVNVRKIVEADEILLELHKGIQNALKQEETKTRDGMDLALCVIDQKTKILKFAGAKNPMICIQGNHLREIKGTNKPIGGLWRGANEDFEKRFVNLGEETVFYLFSDGFQDQFGGTAGRKFMKKNLKELLLEIHHLDMDEQQRILEKTIEEWMQAEDYQYKQIDDIMILGVRISTQGQQSLRQKPLGVERDGQYFHLEE